MWSWTWFITLNATQIKGSLPQNHCISQLKSLLFLRKERLCRLNEFRWLNVFACHSGVKSYLMADTQFMAGPPLSQWQVTSVTGKALSARKAKDRHYIREKELKRCAWEMKLEKSSWFAHSNTGLATDLSPLTSLCQTRTSLSFQRTHLFLLLKKRANFISVSTDQLPWLRGEKWHGSLISFLFCPTAVCPNVTN